MIIENILVANSENLSDIAKYSNNINNLTRI